MSANSTASMRYLDLARTTTYFCCQYDNSYRWRNGKVLWEQSLPGFDLLDFCSKTVY